MRALAGQRFGRWVVVKEAERAGGKRYWHCLCDCGKEAAVQQGNLLSKRSKSCGCVSLQQTIERCTTHGMSKLPVYIAWAGMLSRCTNPNQPAFKRYGGRGIKVCKRWQKFENFIADMKLPPKGMTLDRIDNNGDYKPSNCRWATLEQQARNTAKNRWLTYKGRKQCLADWSKELGLASSTLYRRLAACGWSMERALTA